MPRSFARNALPPDDRPPIDAPAQREPPGGAGEVNDAPDRARGLALEVGAIVDQVAEAKRLIALIDDNTREVDASLLDRNWGILNSAAIRLHALAGHLVKAVERRPARARKAA